MATSPVTLDFSKAIPISSVQSEVPNAASALQGAVSYGAAQDPDKYAKQIQLQKQTGLAPVVTNGNEQRIQQAADVNSINYQQFATNNPRTTSWASNPDNAAVAGVPEVQRLGAIENNAATWRALTPWESFKLKYETPIDRKLMEFPLTRMGVDAVAGATGMLGNIGSFLGWHGNGPSKQNILQHIENNLDPSNFGNYVNGRPDSSNEMDWLAKNVAPMIPAVLTTGGTSFLARTLGLSPTAAKVLSGLAVGGMFTADQGGKTYTSVAGSGGSDYESRLAANKVAAINAIPNALFGATELTPFTRNNPLLTSLGLGGLQGATGQVGSNVVSGKPWGDNVMTSAIQAMAMQGGMHLGTEAFMGNLADAIQSTAESKLRERSPEKFQEAMGKIFEGDDSLRIPSQAFSDYFRKQGADPKTVAETIGSTNYAEAILSGGDVEVPKDGFLGKLDPEHQKGLFPDVIDPVSGLSLNQHLQGSQELKDWVANGGAEKLQQETADADAETASSPEYLEVREQLRQRYAGAGESPEVAETLATKDANAYSNLARSAGLTPVELLNLYNPKVKAGEPADTVLYQSGSPTESLDGSVPPPNARGWFRILPDGTYEIGKTKIGDLSTFVHEPGHAYLKIIGDLAKRDGASDTLKADHQKILDFLGAKDGQPFTREQQETWARANEQYLREGNAPSPRLKGVFQRFAVWLSSVYKKASDLGVSMSDDIRGVFDRLYASEEGVNKAEAEAGPRLFKSAEDAGWTEEQFKQYADDNNVSVEQAKSHILGMLNEAALRDKTQAWRDEEKNVREAVTADIDQKPEYAAIRQLRKGELDDGTEFTMSRNELVKQFGEDRIKELQKQHPGLYRNEGGLEPETAAEMLGFTSAEQMVKSLESSPRRSAAIETATRAYMTAKHGDIRYDGTLDDQARLAYENDKRSDSLYKELKALKQKVADMKASAAGQKEALRAINIAPIDSYREAAHQMVESKPVADLQPTRYLDASRKYSREAFDALKRGDTQAAAEAKHKELMNHFLFREAAKAKEYIAKFESYVKRTQSKGVQQKLGLAGADFRDQFNRLMSRYGLAPAPKEAPIRTLAEWSAAQYEEGKEPAVDPALLDETRTVNYRNAPVSEIRQLHDALVNIRALANQELGIEVNGKRIEFDAAKANMVEQARQSLKSKPTRVLKRNATFGEKAGDLAERGNALLMRTEFLMKWLDGGDKGPWHDYLWNLASDSQGNEYKLQAEVTKRIGDALQNMSKEQRLKMTEKVTIDGIPETVTRHDLVSMAFNMGNEGNLERLEKTFIAHGWDPAAIDRIQGTLTREEWQFVQDGWNSLKPLGAAQSDLEKRLTGLPPVMVKPTPLHIQLADGSKLDLDGGYYPVVMDTRFSKQGARADAGTTAQNLMETGYGRAATSRGNMKERTGFGGPLQLDYEQVLTSHTAKVIKDITHREFMLTANKLLISPEIRQTIRETLGDGYEEKMMPWLRTIINDRNGSAVQGLGDVSRIIRSLRTNLVKAALTFKASTVLLQVTHASSMFNYTSPGSYAQAMVDFLAHPKAMSEEIRNLSPNEMASRGENIDRDMRTLIQTETGQRGIGHTIARAGMMPVQFMDHLMSFPLWLSVYREGLKEGVELPEDRAKYLAMQKADGAVRMGLGSNAPKDLPPIMRNNDFTKLITTLGGFHNLKWNQMSDITHDARNGGSIGKLTYGALMAAIIPPILGQLVTGHGPKDDENPGLWAAKRALLFPAETLPLIGNVVEGMERKGDVSFSPLQGMVERLAKAGYRASSDSDQKDWTGIGMDALQSAMEGFGVVGTDQAFKTLHYARRVDQGTIENPSAWDAVVGASRK